MTATTSSSSGASLTPAQKKARRQHLKTTKNRPADIEEGWTPFRAAEKRFKAKWPPPDLSSVLDLHPKDSADSDGANGGPSQRGRRDVVEWREVDVTVDGKGKGRAYVFPRIPGLVYLPGFVSPEEQRHLVHWSLKEHAKPPNETNLDAHYALPREGLWNAYLNSLREGVDEETIQPKASTSLSSSPDTYTDTLSGPRTLISNPPASPSLLPTLLTLPTPPPAPSPYAKPCTPATLVPKLRWANIGWHYHWGNKQYDFARGSGGGVAAVYRAVCTRAVRGVDWAAAYRGVEVAHEDEEQGPFEEWRAWPEEYEPDAGIVNFYQTRDTLMAHVDRSELCATSPLVSISLGCAAIFLIGGPTRDTEPVPILLRSGDVLIMSGPCRRSYHGVPRILEHTCPSHLLEHAADEEDDWAPYAEYMRNARINVNVRQVFPRGFDPGLSNA